MGVGIPRISGLCFLEIAMSKGELGWLVTLPIIDTKMKPRNFYINIRFFIAIWKTVSQIASQPAGGERNSENININQFHIFLIIIYHFALKHNGKGRLFMNFYFKLKICSKMANGE